MVEIKESETLNHLNLCEESNQKLINRLNYQYHRYGVRYTMCLIKLSDFLIKKGVNLKHYLRNTDEIININDKYKFIFFAHTDIGNTYKALLALEKNLVNNFFQFRSHDSFLFEASIIEKTKLNTTSEMIKHLKKLLLSNESKDEFIFFQE